MEGFDGDPLRQPAARNVPLTRLRRHLSSALFTGLVLSGAFFVVPGHAAARCFGVPEPGPIGPGWSVNLTLTAPDGQGDSARFGAFEGATPFEDEGLDLPQDFSNGSLYLYFEVPTFRGPRGGGTALVDVSVNGPAAETSWRLTVLYVDGPVQDFTLAWSSSEVAAVPASWSLTIDLPGAASVDMRLADSVGFRMGPRLDHGTIVGRNAEPDPPVSSETIVVAGLAYAALVGLAVALRVRRRGRSRGR